MTTAILLTGCSTVGLGTGRVAPPPPGSALNGAWQLVDADVDGHDVPTVRLHPATFELRGTKSQLRTGCNVAGPAITTSPWHVDIGFHTEVSCPRDTGRVEAALFTGLPLTGDARIEDGRLVISGGGARFVFISIPALDLDSIRGSRWHVVAAVEGGVTTPAVHRRAMPSMPLSVSPSGRISARSPCRGFEAHWDPGWSVLFMLGNGAAPHHCSAADLEVDAAMVDVMVGELQYVVRGDHLFLQSYHGPGLVLERDR